ncbi:hypothetical protein BV20DRAFT_647882 [Pilatotrama ljubarskyi]|nr:hypothetical protein BV20DRAFT_647882 [Pilatotrama ljubarskyi]
MTIPDTARRLEPSYAMVSLHAVPGYGRVDECVGHTLSVNRNMRRSALYSHNVPATGRAPQRASRGLCVFIPSQCPSQQASPSPTFTTYEAHYPESPCHLKAKRISTLLVVTGLLPARVIPRSTPLWSGLQAWHSQALALGFTTCKALPFRTLLRRRLH